jgi:hypothetical protein
MNRIVFIVLILVVFSSIAMSQSFAPRLGLNAGFSMPINDFAKKDGSENAGFAQFGYTGTAELDIFFGNSGFGWSTHFSYIANDYQTESTIEWIPDFELHDSGAYVNYSLLTGIKYAHDFGDSFTAFAVGQIGLNYAKGPFFGGIVTDMFENMAIVDVQMDNHTTQGISLGLGFIANRTTTVAIRYFHLGAPPFSGSSEYTLNEQRMSVSHEWEQPISMILLTIGYTISFE